MARLNNEVFVEKRRTHEQGLAYGYMTDLEVLRRSVLSCFLWEDSFYEDGQSISDRIKSYVHKVRLTQASDLAIEAREEQNLRHAPLFIARAMANHPDLSSCPFIVSKTLERVIQRPDELAEFLKIYWKDGKTPISAQVKKGLAAAFTKFNEYQLAKWNRKHEIKLKDVLFMCHARPKNKEQASLWERLVNDSLDIPDTWEVALSSGQDKKKTFERMLVNNTLPSYAFLANLRNMKESGVSKKLVSESLSSYSFKKVLPFRFISAANSVPDWEDIIEEAFFKKIDDVDKIKGRTILLVDVSGSMSDLLSARSKLTKMEAATSLAILCKEACEDVSVYTFSSSLVNVPNRRGFGLKDAILKSQPHSSTFLWDALKEIERSEKCDRLVVISDEQSSDTERSISFRSYMLNVASYENGVSYRNNWTNISGWSDNAIKYIYEIENVKKGT